MDCLHPFSLPPSPPLVGFPLTVASLGINYPGSYWLPIGNAVCVCICQRVSSMSVSLSFFLCSFPRLPVRAANGRVCPWPAPPPHQPEDGPPTTAPYSPLPYPPSASVQGGEMRAQEEWFRYVPNLCKCRKAWSYIHVLFPKAPLGLFWTCPPRSTPAAPSN